MKIFFYLFVALATFVSCSKKEEVKLTVEEQMIGTWELLSIDEYDASGKDFLRKIIPSGGEDVFFYKFTNEKKVIYAAYSPAVNRLSDISKEPIGYQLSNTVLKYDVNIYKFYNFNSKMVEGFQKITFEGDKMVHFYKNENNQYRFVFEKSNQDLSNDRYEQ